jgi:NADH-quinone oxidoreductase subunit H
VSLLGVVEVLGLFAALMTLATAAIWFERRLLGLVQERLGPNRVGPLGVLQPLADVIKLIAKEDWVPPFADRPLFVLAPLIVATTALVGFAVVPVTPTLGVVDLDVGLLFFLGVGSLSVYSALAGGYASNSSYSLLGGLRAAAQSVSYEVFLGLSLLGVVALAGSFDLRDIVLAQSPVWFVVYQPLGFVIFIVAGVAEMHRTPFDLPEAEAELVAGFHSEYSSMKFGLFFVGEYASMVTFASAATALFLGGWGGPWLPPLAWFVLKVLLLLGLFVLIRGSLPRPRVDQLMAFGWKVLLPLCLLQLLVTGALVLALDPAPAATP